MRYLLDTCVLSELVKSSPNPDVLHWIERRNAADAWAQLTVRAEASGKSIAAFDSLIVATAMRHALKLVTRNVRDFVYADIDLLNPWDQG